MLGRRQLKRLDSNIEKRNENLRLFLKQLDETKYRTDFKLEGCSNYAFNLVLKEADTDLVQRVMKIMADAEIEFRRGSSGGGNQMRQPYLKGIVADKAWEKLPQVEHIHFYGFYIGNFPDLTSAEINTICEILNSA